MKPPRCRRLSFRAHVAIVGIAVAGALPLAAAVRHLYVEHAKPYFALQQIVPDEQGIPWMDYGTVGGRKVGRQRNPVTVAQEALRYHDRMEQEDGARTRFLNCANWLVETRVRHGDHAVLEFRFDWPAYSMKAPWRSSMAQGQALQVLVRAHSTTKDDRYLTAAKELLRTMFVAVDQGGVTHFSEGEGWWYEEAAGSSGPPPRILNGMVYTMLGIREYFEYTGDPDADRLFRQGLVALRTSLEAYDCPERGTTYYDRIRTYSDRHYHRTHVDLMDRLYAVTGENIFRDYRDRWKAYRPPSFMVDVFREPSRRRILLVLGSAILLLIILEGAALILTRTRRSAPPPA